VVQKIDMTSAQLAEALAGGTPIIVTTLQTFPLITEKMADLPSHRICRPAVAFVPNGTSTA